MDHKPVQSIDRIFDIIEILSTTPSGMILKDISSTSGLHRSTVHRLLSCLVDRGYVYKDISTGKYCLTLRFFEIGCTVSGTLDLVSIAREQLDELSEFAQEAVHLVKREGNSVVYLYKTEPSKALFRMASHVGRRNPLYCTGVGKSILAHLPETEVEHIWLTSEVQAITEKTITDFNELKKQLLLARTRGYAIDNEENEIGVYCIAAPIFNWASEPIGAVSISTPLNRMTRENEERLLPRLLSVTRNVSVQLGYKSSV